VAPIRHTQGAIRPPVSTQVVERMLMRSASAPRHQGVSPPPVAQAPEERDTVMPEQLLTPRSRALDASLRGQRKLPTTPCLHLEEVSDS
jgi:hypothetical protein